MLFKILSDKEIIDAVSKGELIVTGFSGSSVTPNGYDLSIDKSSIDLMEPISLGDVIEGRVVFTREYIKLLPRQYAMLFLKSRFSRVGGWGSFGFVDAGFSGILQFSIYLPKKIWDILRQKDDTRMVQIVFFESDSDVAVPYALRSGNFQGLTAQKVKSEGSSLSWGVLDVDGEQVSRRV